jgi:hypothetical protein
MILGRFVEKHQFTEPKDTLYESEYKKEIALYD